jgi:serine/threonine protein kinase
VLSSGAILAERYRIEKTLRRGGMGAVYLATDMRLADSPCALKEMLDELRDGDTGPIVERRFRDEMAVLSRLQHAGVPRVRDFFAVDDSLFLVMDLIEGINLEEELVTQGPFSERRVVEDAIALLDIVGYLHAQRPPVLHRDIKPANVIRQPDNHLVLVDFGLARRHDDRTSATRMATIGYAPLEQLQGRATERSDLMRWEPRCTIC